MPVAVNMPTRRPDEPQKDPLDTVLKGLQIAGGIFGIKEGIDKANQLKADKERQAKLDERSAENQAVENAYKEAQAQKSGYVFQKDPVTGKISAVPIEGFRDLDQDAKKIAIDRDRLAIDKMRRELGQLNTNPIAAKYEKAPSTEKEKVGSYASILGTLTQYEDAFRGGQRKNQLDSSLPIVGRFMSDNDIDSYTMKISDDIGRLRSGGAINKDEEARFMKMLPRAGDNDADAARKLLDLRKEIGFRLQGFGIKPEDLPQLGFNPEQLGLAGKFAEATDRGLLSGKRPAPMYGKDANSVINYFNGGGALTPPPANAEGGGNDILQKALEERRKRDIQQKGLSVLPKGK